MNLVVSVDNHDFVELVSSNEEFLELIADYVAGRVSLDGIAEKIDCDDLADRVDMSDLAEELNYRDLADYVPASEVATEIDMSDLCDYLDYGKLQRFALNALSKDQEFHACVVESMLEYSTSFNDVLTSFSNRLAEIEAKTMRALPKRRRKLFVSGKVKKKGRK